MRGSRQLKLWALAVAAGVAAAACGPGTTGPSEELAADQTLRLPMVDDVETLDPGQTDSGVDIQFVQELFYGLYRFDNDLNIVPAVASAMPDVSADGLIYTIKLRTNAKFSNGDPIKAQDFIYAWNRAYRFQKGYASAFDPVKGAKDFLDKRTTSMAGLVARDDFTLVITLSQPAGYFLTQLALWVSAPVDKKVVDAKGEDKWWTTADGLVGNGPFKMTARTPGASMDFASVDNWWGGPTGTLKKVHVEIIKDQSSQVKKYESGGFDIIGPANNKVPGEDVLRYKNDPTKVKDLLLKATARTTWVGFNYSKGPFKGAAGKDGRLAFSQAIDRQQLTDIACTKSLLCAPATGGMITKGLKGYLGDNADPTAKFDAAAAKAAYQRWDPDKSKVRGLTYWYNATSFNKAVAENLQSQWKANLGVDVALNSSDFPTFKVRRRNKEFDLFRDSWGADYDHPQDWFDFLFTCAQAVPGRINNAGYCNPQLDALVAKANKQQVDKALPDYIAAGKMLVDDAMSANLLYDNYPFLIKTYVKGAGFNALYDYSWTGIKILKH